MWWWFVLLLQLGHEFVLVVQLVSQVADLFLVDLSVGLDLLLHSLLNINTHTAGVTIRSSLRTHF